MLHHINEGEGGGGRVAAGGAEGARPAAGRT